MLETAKDDATWPAWATCLSDRGSSALNNGARHIPSCRRPLTDDAVDESQWARGGGGLLTGSQSGYGVAP